MPETVIRVENLGKRYRLGTIGRTALHEDLSRWWARLRGLPDPTLRLDAADPAAGAPPDDAAHVWALRDVAFEVGRGEVLGAIGRNGAGKSTLLKILSRVTAPTLGCVKIKGRIASLLEVGTGFHPELTGRENLFLNGAILGMRRAEIRGKLDAIVDFAGVDRFIDTPVKRYSSGMYVRLAFAVAAHLEPEILVVDEVLAVGDAEFQQKCLGKMRDVAGHGRTVIFVSHNMAAVTQLTDRCLVLDRGRLDFWGPTDEAVRRYLGSRGTAAPARPGTGLDCQRRVRHDPRAVVTEARLRLDPATGVRVGGCLRLDIGFRTERAFEALRFGYTVADELGAPLLSGWSPAFPVAAGRHARSLVLSALPLAPGEYSLSLALMTGGLEESKYAYDILFGLVNFTVLPLLEDGRPLGPWLRGWGSVAHQSSAVVACDEEEGHGGRLPGGQEG